MGFPEMLMGFQRTLAALLLGLPLASASAVVAEDAPQQQKNRSFADPKRTTVAVARFVIADLAVGHL